MQKDGLNRLFKDIEFIKKGRYDKINNNACCFDIEVSSFYSNDEKRACMYAWGFAVNDNCIFGRTWQEFIDLYNYIVKTYETTTKKRFIIYVHNLSYEFQFIKKYFPRI